MAKPLGAKSRVIREFIAAHPGMGNTELAETINFSDAAKEEEISVTASEVSAQRQALKKLAEKAAPAEMVEFTPPYEPAAAAEPRARKKPGPRPTAAITAAPALPSPAAQTDPVDLIDKVFDLAEESGGLEQLKRLVDRLAETQRV
jgi:hypothetical protein